MSMTAPLFESRCNKYFLHIHTFIDKIRCLKSQSRNNYKITKPSMRRHTEQRGKMNLN